jgi:hypothetical protein
MAIDYAIEHATSDQLVIATDSLSSLHALQKTIRRPHLTACHRHARLLQSIVSHLKARDDASMHTMLLKVRAHSGINGNEEADKLAKAAANDECTIPEIASPAEHTATFHWKTADTGTRLSDAAALLREARAARIARVIAEDPSSTAAKWAKNSEADVLLPNFSSKFRSARTVPRRVKRTILQLRCGRWIANGLLHKWKMAPSGRCPHCQARNSDYDDGNHTLAECYHTVLKGMRTHRHDAATHIIVDAIAKSHHERPWHLNVSAGRRFQDSTAPLTDTIPSWALPGNTLRPDLVLILGWSADMPIPERPTLEIEFIIGDVTYGRGYTNTNRIMNKQQKYQQLATALRARGWSVRTAQAGTCAPPPPPPTPATPQPAPHLPQYDSILVFSFGTTGEIYESNLHAFRAFGIDKHQCTKLATTIHFTSIKWAADILRTRRAIDKAPNAQPAPAAPREGEG